MNLKNLFIASAVVSGLLGLGLVLAPTPLMIARTGQPPDLLTTHIAQQFGTAMLAVAAVSWMARHSVDSAARNAIILGLTLLYTLLPIETALSILRGSESVEGFALVIIMGALAAGFFRLGQPRLKPHEE